MPRLDHYWYDRNPVAWLLLPLSWLFCALVALRRLAYRLGWLRVEHLPVPVVVVGNITVGGSGKTPFILWLAGFLCQQGFRPGIVSRGYGGRANSWPQPVNPDSEPSWVGDEPVLIAGRSGCPMMAGPDRVGAARELLLRHPEVDLILSDDGMQHYRLGREVEIAVVDGRRGLGNGWCLPAGPLRERAGRLDQVTVVVENGGEGEHAMRLIPGAVVNLADGRSIPPAELGERVHAVAGIGDPARFFATLRNAGLTPVEHPFPDHYAFRAPDLEFDDELPVVMTEKDAVKCRAFAAGHHWYLPVESRVSPTVGERILNALKR